jgi:hypothetical protein
MRLKEERLLMVLEAVGLLFIVLATIGYDYANSKIEQRRIEMSEKVLGITLSAVKLLDNQQTSHFFSTLLALNASIDKEEEVNNIYEYSALKDLREKLNKKEISSRNYLEQRRNVASQVADAYRNRYNTDVVDYNKMVDGKSFVWDYIQKIFNFIRIFAVVVSAFLYLFLYKAISERTNKRESVSP